MVLRCVEEPVALFPELHSYYCRPCGVTFTEAAPLRDIEDHYVLSTA